MELLYLIRMKYDVPVIWVKSGFAGDSFYLYSKQWWFNCTEMPLKNGRILLKIQMFKLKEILHHLLMIPMYRLRSHGLYGLYGPRCPLSPERPLTLTHWGRGTHICVRKLTIISSVNGLSPGRRQAIIWTNDGILLTEPLGTNFSEILIEIHTFSFKKMHLKMSSGNWWPFCLGLTHSPYIIFTVTATFEQQKFLLKGQRHYQSTFNCHILA